MSLAQRPSPLTRGPAPLDAQSWAQAVRTLKVRSALSKQISTGYADSDVDRAVRRARQQVAVRSCVLRVHISRGAGHAPLPLPTEADLPLPWALGLARVSLVDEDCTASQGRRNP